MTPKPGKLIIPKHAGGRPAMRRFTPEQRKEYQEQILQVIRKANTLKTAADLVGIGEGTVSEWRGKYPSFDEEIKRVQAEVKQELTLELRKNIENRNYKQVSIFFLLQKLYPEEYGDKQRFEHTGKDGQPIIVRIIRYADKKTK